MGMRGRGRRDHREGCIGFRILCLLFVILIEIIHKLTFIIKIKKKDKLENC